MGRQDVLVRVLVSYVFIKMAPRVYKKTDGTFNTQRKHNSWFLKKMVLMSLKPQEIHVRPFCDHGRQQK